MIYYLFRAKLMCLDTLEVAFDRKIHHWEKK